MAAALFDGQGCLTPAAFAAIAAAPPGAAPAELAAHLAGCARCQRRLLAKALGPAAAPRGPRRERPPLWRTAVAIFAILILVGIVMMVAQALMPSR
jgi:hypothetical protein